MTKHPWHEVNRGPNPPEIVHAIIEIPRGSRTKYEVDKDSGLIRMDRVLYGAMFYPINYGFIPQSYGGDKDPLDILVLSQADFVPLSIVNARVIGVMQMVDSGDADDKIIAVAENDISVSEYRTMADLPNHFLLELRNFFEEYKKLENKTVFVDDFQTKEKALDIIRRSFIDYDAKFKK